MLLKYNYKSSNFKFCCTLFPKVQLNPLQFALMSSRWKERVVMIDVTFGYRIQVYT